MSITRTVGYWFYTGKPEEKKQPDPKPQPEEKPLKPWQKAEAETPAKKEAKKKQPAGPLRKDGTPDMRYKANW